MQSTDSLERLLLATTFACASYFGSIHRDAKPFNPMLGETYEYQDSRSWFLAEQVWDDMVVVILGKMELLEFIVELIF